MAAIVFVVREVIIVRALPHCHPWHHYSGCSNHPLSEKPESFSFVSFTAGDITTSEDSATASRKNAVNVVTIANSIIDAESCRCHALTNLMRSQLGKACHFAGGGTWNDDDWKRWGRSAGAAL